MSFNVFGVILAVALDPTKRRTMKAKEFRKQRRLQKLIAQGKVRMILLFDFCRSKESFTCSETLSRYLFFAYVFKAESEAKKPKSNVGKSLESFLDEQLVPSAAHELKVVTFLCQGGK